MSKLVHTSRIRVVRGRGPTTKAMIGHGSKQGNSCVVIPAVF